MLRSSASSLRVRSATRQLVLCRFFVKLLSPSRQHEEPMRARPHERFSTEITLTPSSVADCASAVGDTNPMHHDAEFAAASRYGRRIASGTHTTALLLALTASHFSKHGAMV